MTETFKIDREHLKPLPIGYLKVVNSDGDEPLSDGLLWVAIPNREIEKVFVCDIISKVRRYTRGSESDAKSVEIA